MPNGFDVVEASELLAGWTQGGTVPAEHESGSTFIAVSPGTMLKLRAAFMKLKNTPGAPASEKADAEAWIKALDAPGKAAWRSARPEP